jgi:uroporphyrinogen-III synthase
LDRQWESSTSALAADRGTNRLVGRRIVLPDHPASDRLAAILAAEGASTIRASLVAIQDAADPASVESWLRALAAGRFDTVILTSAEGVRRIVKASRTLGIEVEVSGALARARRLVRGAQTASVLQALGLPADAASPAQTDAGVVESLRGLHFQGSQVGLQLTEEGASAPLVEFLVKRGAEVFPVVPYRFVDEGPDAEVAQLIDRLDRGEIDAIVFSHRFEIERLVRIMEQLQPGRRLRDLLSRIPVVAAGTAVAAALRERGIDRVVIPPRQHFARRLIDALAGAWESS